MEGIKQNLASGSVNIFNTMLRRIHVLLPATLIAVRPMAHSMCFHLQKLKDCCNLGLSARSRQISTVTIFGGNEATGSHPELPTSRSNIPRPRPKESPRISGPLENIAYLHAFFSGHYVSVIAFRATGSRSCSMSLENTPGLDAVFSSSVHSLK